MEQQSRSSPATTWKYIIVALVAAAAAFAVALIAMGRHEPSAPANPSTESKSTENFSAGPAANSPPVQQRGPVAQRLTPAPGRGEIQHASTEQREAQPQIATTVVKQACVNSNTTINQPTINNCGDVSQ